MIAVHTFKEKTAAVFGLARTGLGAVHALVAGGARVLAWDDSARAREDGAQAGAQIVPWREWPWEEIAALILSPGVPLTHPRPHEVVVHAGRAGVPVIGDVELFAAQIRPDPAGPGRAPVIAITGTNGKSTTTALIAHILKAGGYDAQMGGNIGKSVLELAPPGPKTIYVLEMSSFQIDLTPGLVPDVAVLSNITPDHLDRHGTMENYAAIKARLVRHAYARGRAVIGVDDDYCAAIFTRAAARGGPPAVPVSVGKVLGRGIFAVDGILYDACKDRALKVMDMGDAHHLPGVHNWQNAALAYGAVQPYMRDAGVVSAAIASFPGLAHRMEDVGSRGKVRFVNDSKATNADAAARALAVWPDIFWIAGGKPKVGGIESLVPFFPQVRKAYLIGEAAPAFARTLEGKAAYEISGTLDVALAHAAADAAASEAIAPVVLLSPACASYDQFNSFEHRGDIFRTLVAGLTGAREAAQ